MGDWLDGDLEELEVHLKFMFFKPSPKHFCETVSITLLRGFLNHKETYCTFHERANVACINS